MTCNRYNLNLFIAALLFGTNARSLSVAHPVTFDDDHLGLYSKQDFFKDWSISPTQSSGQGSCLSIVVYLGDPGVANGCIKSWVNDVLIFDISIA